ncbi:protein of unknown function [Xenorhabdus poinarii G6]|uniref:Transposase n=1 Tax=Xenorhabdus poinarii G6 TaxID=1354304 RepID=A0A068R2F5_9GAMM|nr:protein of unknown function [Xenorhabdus poinarii G6]
MKYTPVGVDTAKYLMQIHFVDKYTGEIMDKQLRRRDFLTFFSNRDPCLIGMGACGGAHYWARELKKLGYEVHLLQAKFVKAFRISNKNDVMDARAIWMAVQQPGKPVAIKNEEQQTIDKTEIMTQCRAVAAIVSQRLRTATMMTDADNLPAGIERSWG